MIIPCLVGPTASGKSSLALFLAQELKKQNIIIEIINVDSALIYQGMDVGTAKPTQEEQELIPHHLLDVISPLESWSVADFLQQTAILIEEITSKPNHIPLLVGGTMMYFNALLNPIAPMPSVSLEISQQIQYEAQQYGWDFLHEQLMQHDPISGQRIAVQDKQRIERALGIFRQTNKTLTQWQQGEKSDYSLNQSEIPCFKKYDFRFLSLEPFNQSTRQHLRNRIRQRFTAMMEQYPSILDEVEILWQESQTNPEINLELPSLRCVGYRQLWSYLEGEDSLEQAVEKAILATGQLAKRQLTWLQKFNRTIIDYVDPQLQTIALAWLFENLKIDE